MTTSTPASIIPAQQEKPDFSSIALKTGARLYSLHYRQGTKKPDSFIFEFDGTLPQAINKARWYCEEMNYTFCGCYSHVKNLDTEVKNRLIAQY